MYQSNLRMSFELGKGSEEFMTEKYNKEVKKDLKALNPSVKVTQKEYDEVVIVKPLFTVIDYK